MIPAEGQLLLSLPRSKKPFYFKPKEKDVEKSICDWLRIKGFFFWKQPSSGFFDTNRKCFRRHVSPYVKAGVPDIIVVHQGRFIGIEVKSATGRQSESQKDFEQELLSRGQGNYFIARSVEDVENQLKERGVL